jgi:hypothetical protein
MTGFLFDLSFWLASPVWLLLIFAPNWRHTARIAASPLTVVPVLVVYLALAIPVFPDLWAAVSGPDIEGFRDLTVLANGAGAVWAQVIAWDLLLGQWMFLEARPGDPPPGDEPAAGADDPSLADRPARLPRPARGDSPLHDRRRGPGRRTTGVALTSTPTRRVRLDGVRATIGRTRTNPSGPRLRTS